MHETSGDAEVDAVVVAEVVAEDARQHVREAELVTTDPERDETGEPRDDLRCREFVGPADEGSQISHNPGWRWSLSATRSAKT